MPDVERRREERKTKREGREKRKEGKDHATLEE